MGISQQFTSQWIEQNENSNETYSYADVCTLLNMRTNEINRFYVHDSVTDINVLRGYSKFDYLNDDEVKLLIDYYVNVEKERNEIRENIENMQLQARVRELETNVQLEESQNRLADAFYAISNISDRLVKVDYEQSQTQAAIS